MQDRLVALLSDLVAIESVNPSLGGARGEVEVARFVEHHCRRLGLDVDRQAILPGRDNVLVDLVVPGARSTLLLEAHMDTVGLDGLGDAGLRPEVRDGRLYGRGACDTKGSLASMLVALELLLERRRELAVNVTLLAAADEEFQYRGVLAYIERGRTAHAAIVGEPTDLRVVVAHKGCLRTRITTIGRAAHSSRPYEGVNAIDHMVPVLDALRVYGATLGGRSHPLVGSPTISVGRIWGGTSVSTVPDRCTVEIDRRLIPGEDASSALAEIDAVLAGLRSREPGLGIELERESPFVADWPLDTPPDAGVVRAASAACREVGLPDGPVGVSYGSDASKLWALRGMPSIVLGPGSIAQAHTVEEFVEITQLPLAAKAYALAALHLGGGDEGGTSER